MTSEITPHLWFPEPKLSFHPERVDDVDTHPLRGLLRFGPYSSSFVPDPIRVATIAPAGEGHRLYDFMKALNSEYEPKERKDYLPKWPGFSGAFNLHMRGATKPCHIELDDRLEGEMRSPPRRPLAARCARRTFNSSHSDIGDQARRVRRDLFIRANDLVAGFLRRN